MNMGQRNNEEKCGKNEGTHSIKYIKISSILLGTLIATLEPLLS